MPGRETSRQAGMTLIEVLVAMLILSTGFLGAAAVQVSALKYTSSAQMKTQASFIAYDMLDRIRANAGADYSVAALDQIQSSLGVSSVLAQDLRDFKHNIRQFGGASASGSIAVSDRQISINIAWDDSRAANKDGLFQTFTLTSEVAPNFLSRAS